MIKQSISELIDGNDLSMEEAMGVMEIIMNGDATSAQISAFITALRFKGETPEEIAGMARIMREKSVSVHINNPVLDTCGTGGDGANTLNISTATGLLVSSAGITVAKHGNRAMSGSTGSADVLEAAGINIELNAKQVTSCVENGGIGFMFAPMHHSAMKHAIGPRRELGLRTLFNVLGPLTNPASAPNQVIGVFDKKWLTPLAETLNRLGSKHVLVVHSEDGMDDISISAKTFISELKNNEINNYEISPDDFGIKNFNISDLSVKNIDESLAMMKSVLDNNNDAAKAIVSLNAGAAIYASGISDSINAGVEMAINIIESGAAKKKFEMLIQHTKSFNA